MRRLEVCKSSRPFLAVVQGKLVEEGQMRCFWLWRWRKGKRRQGPQVSSAAGRGQLRASRKQHIWADTLILAPWKPFQTWNLQNWKVIYLCYFRPISVWSFATAAIGHQQSGMTQRETKVHALSRRLLGGLLLCCWPGGRQCASCWRARLRFSIFLVTVTVGSHQYKYNQRTARPCSFSNVRSIWKRNKKIATGHL